MAKRDEELMTKRNELMARDLVKIEQIRAYGVDLEKKRQIDLAFWSPTEETCKLFVGACKQNDMPPALVLAPASSEQNQRWLVRCPISASVVFVTAKENVVTFLLFADKYGCEYDGWGTALVEVAAKN